MGEQQKHFSSKKEFAFASSTILSQVDEERCWSRRRSNRRSFHLTKAGFQSAKQVTYQDHAPSAHLFIIGLVYVFVCWLSAKLTRSERCNAGSGILKSKPN